MLRVVGAESLDALIDEDGAEGHPAGRAAVLRQAEVRARGFSGTLRQVANKNDVFTTMIGQGFYGTVTPPAIQRKHSRKPGLVHRLHALPARDQPGAGSRRS